MPLLTAWNMADYIGLVVLVLVILLVYSLEHFGARW
jgi:hypothetical protein